MFHVFKAFEMEKERFENKIRKLGTVYILLKVKPHFEVLKNFRNKKYIKLINGWEGGEGVLIRAGRADFFFFKSSRKRRLFGT